MFIFRICIVSLLSSMHWKNIVFIALPLAGQQLLLICHKVTLYFACRVTGPSKKVTEPAWGSHKAKDTFWNSIIFFSIFHWLSLLFHTKKYTIFLVTFLTLLFQVFRKLYLSISKQYKKQCNYRWILIFPTGY